LQAGLFMHIPRLEARERRERLQERGVRIPGPALLEMLVAEGMPRREAEDEVAAVLAARMRADDEQA
jgi:hypothetical protein